jgi:uncharacterized protein (TIGR03067 family)
MRVAGVATVIFVALAVQGDADAIKKEMAKLEGEWSMVSGEIDGTAMPKEYLKDAKRVAKDGETTVTIAGRTFMKAKFTVDPTKKPKAIDYVFTEGPNKDMKSLGIYEIDGDTVKFCFAKPGKDRPADFTTKEGSERTLSVWKREKK